MEIYGHIEGSDELYTSRLKEVGILATSHELDDLIDFLKMVRDDYRDLKVEHGYHYNQLIDFRPGYKGSDVVIITKKMFVKKLVL